MDKSREVMQLTDQLQRGRISRRDFIKSGALMGLGASSIGTLLAACAPQEAAPAAEEAATAAEEAATAKISEIVVAVSAPPPTLDEEFGGGPSFRSIVNFQDGLLQYGDHSTPEIGPGAVDLNWGTRDINELVTPRMAESYEVSADGKTYTFQLREGWLSHVGNEFTAEDVKWRFDRAFGLGSIGTFFTNVSRLPSADSVKVLDTYTVEFTLEAPSPSFLMSLANHLRITMLDSTEAMEHATDDDPWATEWLKSNYVGFGPYKLESLEPDNQMVLTAHTDHPFPPKVETLIFQFVPDSATRLALLSRGEVDATLGFTPTELKTLQETDGVHVWNFPGNARLAVPMNPNFPPLDDTRVRQALSYAVPYDSIVNEVFEGFARPAGGPLVRLDAGFDLDAFPYTHDLDKARGLLDAAGVADGFETSYAYDASDPLAELVGVQLQTSFAEIGVDLTLDALPAAAYSETLSKGGSPLIYWALGADQPDPAYVTQVWFDSTATTNWTAYENLEVDKLIAEGLNIIDFDERVAHYQQVISTIIDDAPWLFVAELGYQAATRDNMTGLRWDAGHIDWDGVDFA